MDFKDIITKLNDEQKNAVSTMENAVVCAGAGSGKTKTLSARYIRLIIEEKMEVQSILALTFTKKAAVEMYERIYSDLKQFSDNIYAKKAIDNFQKANISTLDSFCHSIAKYSSRHYGITPEFSINEHLSKKIAKDIATSFFLKKIKEPILKELVSYKGIDEVITGLFIKVLCNYVYISNPLNLEEMIKIQKNILQIEFAKIINNINEIILNMQNIEASDSKMITNIKEVVNQFNEIPLLKLFDEKDEKSSKFLALCNSLSKVAKSPSKKQNVVLCKELLDSFREEFSKLLNIYNYNELLVKETFSMIDELQNEYINAKITQGILSYGDVSHIALTSLKEDIELRQYYKKNIKTIMIDEFQDNNQLQRDILFLLAEREERCDKQIPLPEELEKGKLFFVGDEKQSIYAFRGAEVSVFRNLMKDLKNEIKLSKNYRTEKALIDIFNTIFPYIFSSNINVEEDIPSYEATFEEINFSQNNARIDSGMEILYFDKTVLENNKEKETLPASNYEAIHIAQRIKELHDSHFKVRDKETNEPRDCQWSDFAILLRSSTKQSVYERYLKMTGIPYTASTQKGIFKYAPINDLYSIFRLAVYPQDNFCYAQVLKTPFVEISDVGFAQIMLEKKEPFSIELDSILEKEDLKAFQRGKDIFIKLKEALKSKNNAEIIKFLWYETGYRYLLLSNPSYQAFLELYDYLFHLATLADSTFMTHSEFIDLLSDYILDNEIMEEIDIPLTQKKDSVKIMTIHKSKGLEFPIVIIPDLGNIGRNIKKEGMVFYSKDIGLSIHILDKFKSYRSSNDKHRTNFFFEKLKTEEEKKHLAELKRLFYVAMTRAEVKLILSGVIESKMQKENEFKNIKQLDSFLEKAGIPKEKCKSFFDLFILSIHKAKENDGYHNLENLNCQFHEIEPNYNFSFKNYANNIKKSLNEHIQYYKTLPIKSFPKNNEPLYTAAKNSIDDKKDKVLLFDEVNEAIEIGEITHSFLEATLNGKEFNFSNFDISYETILEIEQYKNNFIFSKLGQKAINAKIKKTEYGFITKYDKEKDGKSYIARGVIDLLFESDGIVYIVDYKTDKTKSNKYKRQLSVYKKAVNDLYKNANPLKEIKIKTYLFYLYLNEAVEVITD